MSAIRVTDGATTIDFDPAEGYIEPKILDKTHHRAIDGTALAYKWWAKRRWEIPLDRIAKSDADQFNTWWEALTSLTLTPDMVNASTTTFTVLLRNDTAPVSAMQPKVFATHYAGVLIFEES